MILLALLAGCMQSKPLPDMGDCAEYPEGTYEYGQIGIGTCLAGPVELEFAEALDGSEVLLVTNANPYRLFTGGSLLSIPWEGVDLEAGYQSMSSLDAAALELPSFASALARDDDLGIIAVRLSEEARTRQTVDEVHLVDLTDPGAPAWSSRGTDGSELLAVRSDPVDVVVAEDARLAFVANRTSHSVSVVDLGPLGSTDPLEIIYPWPEASVAASAFQDADLSGSRATLSNLEIVDADLIPDDEWTLTWVEGTWRLWVPEDTGLARLSTPGDGSWQDSALGVELDLDDAGDLVGELEDPFFTQLGDVGRMVFSDGGNLRGAQTGSYAGDWSFETFTTLPGREGSWDAELSGPSLLTDEEASWLWYAGHDDAEEPAWAIGLASSADGQIFTRESAEPVLEPTWDHEAERISEPFVVWDPQLGRWRMLYSAFDGATWTIGHAWSADRLTWTSDPEPVFELPDGDAAAPVLSVEEGRFRMWYARRGLDGLWDVGAAESPDGYTWVDLGAQDLLAVDAEEPPRVAMQAAPTNGFRVEGEQLGSQLFPLSPGYDFAVDAYGWGLRTDAGFHLDAGDFGGDSAGGTRLDSVVPGLSRAWLTIWTSGGTPAIATAAVEADGSLNPSLGPILEGGSDFERDGVSSAVVVEHEGEQLMLYAGHRGDFRSIGLASSPDGGSWDKEGRVLSPSEDWDSLALLPGSVVTLEDGTLQLWYAGSDGEGWRIGSATSTDGRSWTREQGPKGWQLGSGAPGDFDDSGVRSPWAVRGQDAEGNPGTHLWYSGFDGANWRIGYAWRADGSDDWERSQSELVDEARAVVALGNGWFHPLGVEGAVLVPGEDADADGLPDTWSGYYSGNSAGTWRVGRLTGQAEPDRLHKVLQMPTNGDTLGFSTVKGDADADAIALDTTFDGIEITGVGLIALTVDEERGFLYAVSKQTSFVYVIDIRDDSGGVTAFNDANYLDLEAIITASLPGGATGFRQVIPLPGSDRMLALHDQPESVMFLDLSELGDESYGRVIYDAQVGYLPVSRGVERDAGADSQTSVGPAQVLPHPDGQRLFVTNFNANSILVFDLDVGPYGQLVHEIEHVGENPYSMVLSPDGTKLVFANYTGITSTSGYSEATLGVLDIDPASPTYLEVLTWIGNR